jgi:thymidylate synthase ThyX
MAQWEIRQLFKQIRHEIFRVSPFFGSFLAPKCVPLGYCDEMGNRDEHCRIRPHRDSVMAVWDAYRSGDLAETKGPVVAETSPFRPRTRRVPLPVSAQTEAEPMAAARAAEPQAALGQAGSSDRV